MEQSRLCRDTGLRCFSMQFQVSLCHRIGIFEAKIAVFQGLKIHMSRDGGTRCSDQSAEPSICGYIFPHFNSNLVDAEKCSLCLQMPRAFLVFIERRGWQRAGSFKAGEGLCSSVHCRQSFRR